MTTELFFPMCFFHDPKKGSSISRTTGRAVSNDVSDGGEDGEMREMKKVNLFDKQILKCRTQ